MSLRILPDPDVLPPAVFWRCCARCAAWLAYPHNLPQDASVYCATCTGINTASWADFDPRPYPARDQSIRRHSAPGEWCVLARDAEWLTVRRLGFPDRTPVRIHLSDTRPRTDAR